MIDCSKCIHDEVCANKVVNDGLDGECGFYKAEQPQGDLISREALKKCAIPCEIHQGSLTELCVPLYQIDNAPTVDAYTIEDVRDLIGLLEKRPKGEWKLIERKPFIDIACSNCGKVRFKDYAYNCTIEKTLNHLKTVDKDILPIFCENCGADMKGGAE